MTSEPHSQSPDQDRLEDIVADSDTERRASDHALDVLEYALSAPAPRRQRTWLHRVTTAVDALGAALDRQIHAEDQTVGLLSEIALCEPRYAIQIQRLRQEQLDLRIAVASLREQIEPDAEVAIDLADIRDRLATITQRYRQHRASKSDLVHDAVNIDLDD